MRFPIDITKYTLNAEIYKNSFLTWHLFGLKIFGYVIFSDQEFKRLNCFRGMVFTVSFLVFNVTQIMDLVMCDNLDQMMTNASSTLLFVTTSCRMFIFYTKRSKFLKLIKDAHDNLIDIMLSTVNEEKQIYRKHISYIKKLTIGFWISAWMTGNMMCVNTFIQVMGFNPIGSSYTNETFNFTIQPPIIFRSWFPFEDLWENYYLVYGIHFYIMYLGMIIVPCWHSFMVAILIFVIMYLEIINYRLENIKKYVQGPKDSFEKIVWKDTELHEVEKKFHTRRSLLSMCVEDQIKMKKFVSDFQVLNTTPLFGDFVIFSVLICALLFQASKIGFGITLVINVFYIFTMILILWIYYWHADEIYKQSMMTSQAVYNSDWYEQSLPRQKNCLLLMMTSSKPIKLSAFFINLTVSTFLNILRASYSYYTLLAQMDS